MYRRLYQIILEEHRRVFEAQDEADLEKLMSAIIQA